MNSADIVVTQIPPPTQEMRDRLATMPPIYVDWSRVHFWDGRELVVMDLNDPRPDCVVEMPSVEGEQ